jgi:hypothetical protein
MKVMPLDDEYVDEMLEERKHVADSLGMIDYEHFVAFKMNAAHGLQVFGDLFLEGLGIALMEANTKDAAKIIRVWQSECTMHEMLWKMHLAKERALANESANSAILIRLTRLGHLSGRDNICCNCNLCL